MKNILNEKFSFTELFTGKKYSSGGSMASGGEVGKKAIIVSDTGDSDSLYPGEFVIIKKVLDIENLSPTERELLVENKEGKQSQVDREHIKILPSKPISVPEFIWDYWIEAYKNWVYKKMYYLNNAGFSANDYYKTWKELTQDQQKKLAPIITKFRDLRGKYSMKQIEYFIQSDFVGSMATGGVMDYKDSVDLFYNKNRNSSTQGVSTKYDHFLLVSENIINTIKKDKGFKDDGFYQYPNPEIAPVPILVLQVNERNGEKYAVPLRNFLAGDKMEQGGNYVGNYMLGAIPLHDRRNVSGTDADDIESYNQGSPRYATGGVQLFRSEAYGKGEGYLLWDSSKNKFLGKKFDTYEEMTEYAKKYNLIVKGWDGRIMFPEKMATGGGVGDILQFNWWEVKLKMPNGEIVYEDVIADNKEDAEYFGELSDYGNEGGKVLSVKFKGVEQYFNGGGVGKKDDYKH